MCKEEAMEGGGEDDGSKRGESPATHMEIIIQSDRCN